MNTDTRSFLKEVGTAYLTKPFDLDELTAKLRAALKDQKLNVTHNES